MTKVIFNYGTGKFESMEPSMNDRFDLKRLKAAAPLLAPALLPAAATFLGLTGTGLVLQQKIQNYFENNPDALPKFKEYLKTMGMVTPFGTLPGDQPEEEERIRKESKEPIGGGFGSADDLDTPKLKGTEIPKETKKDIPVNIPPKVEPLPGFPIDEEARSPQIFPIKVKGGEKKLYGLTEDEYKARAKEYARQKREREKAGDTEKFRPDPEKELVINTAIKEYRDVAPPIKSGDNRAYKPGNTGFETIKIATEEFRKQYGRNPSSTEIQKYTGNDKGTIRRAFQNHGDILGELMSTKDYRLISPKTVDTKLTEEYQERDRNKLLNEAIELDTARTYKDEVFFKNDERRNFFIDNFIKRANFGLNRKGVPGLTYKELAKKFNMSEGQVSKVIQVLQKDPLISSQLDRPEGRDASYYGTVNKQVLAEGRKQLAPWERSNVDIQDNKVTEVNKILSGLTLDEVKEQYPQIITDFKWKLAKTGDDKGKIIEVDRPDEKLEKDIKKAFSIEHGKNKSTREVDIQRLTNRYFTTKKNNDLLVSIKAYIKREGESSPEINDWLTERGIRIIVDKKSYGAPPEVMFNSKTGEHVSFNKALEFYGLDGDVTGPTKEQYEALKLKDDINEQFGEGTIMTADEAPEPDSSILRRLFQDFKERTGFQDGTPNPIIDELISSIDNDNVFKKVSEENSFLGDVVGKEGDRTMMQRFNTQFLDPRSYPYYAQKTLRGAANIPELAFRFPLAAAYIFGKASLATSTADLSKFSMEDIRTAMEILEPKFTNLALEGKLGDVLGLSPEAIQAVEEKRTGPQKTTGSLLQFGAEAVGPASPVFLFKMFPKLPKQIKDLVGTATAADKVNKEIESRMATQGVDQTRRDLLIATGVGGAVGLLKMLGLDSLFKAAPKAVKATPELVTTGGTPKYFFDFVDLIRKKGKNISEEAGTVAREKVYDYNGYTLYEKLDTGEIRITKDTEGSASYYIGDGEYDTIDGIIRKEEITYTPKETIINDKGKPVEVKDTYDEATMKPDIDGGDGDYDAGLESLDDILEMLSRDGKTYSKEELLKMGVDADALSNYPTGAGSIPEGRIGEADPFKPKKAGGGIMKMAGDESGPPPKSGPTPHGLPSLSKNVRPIKERK